MIELGNGWEASKPVMSTLTMRALLSFLNKGKFFLCQEFICHNPARLPSPAQWVNVKRSRVKDAFTHVWWMSPTPYPKANNRKILNKNSGSLLELLANTNITPGPLGEESLINYSTIFVNKTGPRFVGAPVAFKFFLFGLRSGAWRVGKPHPHLHSRKA